MNARLLLPVALLLLAACWMREEGDFDSCPPTMVRTLLGDAPVCACSADQDGDHQLTEQEIAQRPMMRAGDLWFQGCNADDWVPAGFLFLVARPDGPPVSMLVPEICKVAGEPNTYVGHEGVTCEACDCATSGCLAPACAATCGVSEAACGGGGTFCGDSGGCEPCEDRCGGSCGPCADGSMCVDGTCTGLVRCIVTPSGPCTEKAPTWCPLDARTVAAGAPCSCSFQFPCGSAGFWQATWTGQVER
jgi:hypothetical protein